MLEFLPTPACLCDSEIVTWSLCSLIFPLVQWPKELAFSGIVRAGVGIFIGRELSRYA